MKAVNLLPPDMRGAGRPATARSAADEPTGRYGAFAVLGALAFCVVALAAYVMTENTVKDRKVQLDSVTTQANAVAAQATKLKPYADFAAQAQTRLKTVQDLASARFDWERALRDVSRVVPADVTLSSLSGTISGGTSGGSGLRAAIPAPGIEMQGCTRGGQTDVARLLSRLRDVEGVTRVSLSSSARPAPVSGAAAASASTTTTADGAAGCGNKRPSTFDVVIFFEHSTVPATVQDITTGTGSTPTSSTGTTPATSATASAASTTTSTTSTTTSTTP